MIASLMMYARPELQGAHRRYWAQIRSELHARGIKAPAQLADELDPFAVWSSPDLMFSQTCGMPYRKRLHGKVTIIGTPDYDIHGCPAGYYNSVLVVRKDDPRADLADFATARFAYNETMSQSGYAAPYSLTKAVGFWFRDRIQSHGHVHSARFVAQGQADIAALDAVSWRLMQRYDDFAADLRVIASTAPTPGLPYITAQTAQREALFEGVSAAIAGLEPSDRAALCLRGLVRIPSERYLAIPNPPDTEP